MVVANFPNNEAAMAFSVVAAAGGSQSDASGWQGQL
jgi:hypothetical protein